MKVITAQSSIDKIPSFDWSVYKITLVLVLMASLISFGAGWVINWQLSEHGGINSAVGKWARLHGYKAVNSEQSFLNILKTPYYMVKPADLPQIVLDINFKSFQKLQDKRQKAFNKGLLVTEKGDFVPAKIRHDGETTKVKIRLKGDLLDHLKGDKWSFRVKVKGKKHLFGMRVFSVQNPGVRGFQGAPLFYSTLKHYGVMTPRYKLVELIVNGNDVGTMSLEEHFSKELLESSGRKESVIIKFDENLVWTARLSNWKLGLGGHYDNYHIVNIDGFGSNKISKSKRLSRDYEIAVGLLRGFVDGAIAPSEVFDVKMMARYMAVSELWGSWHSFSWRNLRFYYNPITAKLEPIGFDPDIQSRSPPGNNKGKREPITSVMRTALINDPTIFAEFKQAIKTIKGDMDSGQLFAMLDEVENRHLPLLRKEFFLVQGFDRKELQQRINLLEGYNRDDFDEIYQIHYDYPELIQAFKINTSSDSYLEVSNITPSLVDIVSINWIPKKNSDTLKSTEFFSSTRFPIVLPPTALFDRPKYYRINYESNSNLESDYLLEIISKVQGSEKSVTTQVMHYIEPRSHNPVPVSSIDQQIKEHAEYLVLDSAKQKYSIKRGVWKIYQPIIVPENMTLEIPSGTQLHFEKSAGIISRGALQFKGTNDAKIILQGIGNQTWKGVVTLNSVQPSNLNNVVIKSTTGVNFNDWNLTGGITFYYSDVNIKDTLIEDSRGEDALNIVHSNFTLENVSIRKTVSDAFDADFSTGSVLGGSFQDIGLAGGGDAIDVSGSKVTIEGTEFIDINDKAVSVGEQSQILASNLNIVGTGTGAACKDGSTLELKLSKIHNARIAGLMAYIKKPEYGPGSITATSIDFGDGFERARAQKGSYINIDNEEVESIDIDVEEMYKTVMKKGLN